MTSDSRFKILNLRLEIGKTANLQSQFLNPISPSAVRR
jgi:hypothetical protein